MESQKYISLGDLFSVELFVGSIAFVLGTVVLFLLLLRWKQSLNDIIILLSAIGTCLSLFLLFSFMFWRF